jgi:hypothetical protein
MDNRWRNFDHVQIQALARGPRFRDAPGERACPACGVKAVRSYLYGSERNGNPTVISYTWCSNCHRYSGSTAPRPDGLEFNDPLDQLPTAERQELREDLTGLLSYLDRLWNEGALPQRFRVDR